MPPLVSILIPCHNAAPWLAATLGSALAQTGARLEVIVVDDGSTDESLAVARSFAPAVQVLTQPQGGAARARNRALQAARGDFLQYLDADDLLAPEKIARQLAFLDDPAHAGCLVAGEWARFYGDPATARAQPDGLWQDLDPVSWQVYALRANAMIHPAAWLVPRALSEAAGPWDESLSLNDDGEYFCRVRFASRHVPFCRGSRSLYRSGLPNSLSLPRSARALDSAFRAETKIHARLRQQEDSARTRQACADGWMHYAYTAAVLAPALADQAAAQAAALGGSRLRPPGGRWFRALDRLVGWRRALRIRERIRARRAA